MSRPFSTEVCDFLAYSAEGNGRAAVRVALRLLDEGVPERQVITDLLVPAQAESGRRWAAGEWGVAEEHLVSGSVEATLRALSALSDAGRACRALLVCPEGDWHSIPAQMFALQLQLEGVGIRFLGPSTPVDHVAKLLARLEPDALVVSCAMATQFAGVVRLAAVAHAQGVPVLVGGRGLVDGRREAALLGADAWRPDLAGVVAVLEEWRQRPRVQTDWPPLPVRLLELDRTAQVLATIAAESIREEYPSVPVDYEPAWLPRRHDLELVIHALVSALLVRRDEVFLDYLQSLEHVLVSRGVARDVLRVGLEAVTQVLPVAGSAHRLLQLGLDRLRVTQSA